MPFGTKTIPSGQKVDFDAVYTTLIQPGIVAAGMEPLRADEEAVGGMIHKPMYERLILCDYAVADLTGANANVFYELGLRHGVRPSTTVLLYAGSERMPFDVAPLRALPYKLAADGKPSDVEGAGQALRKLLETAKAARGDENTDSPVFQLVDGYTAPDIARLKTDVFRDRAHYAVEARKRLADARRAGTDALKKAAGELGEVQNLESGVPRPLSLVSRAQ